MQESQPIAYIAPLAVTALDLPRFNDDNIKHRATVLCRRGDEILLVRKAKSKWSLPGGRIEDAETPQEAALRELAEETGLKAERAEFVTSVEWKKTRHYLFEVELPPESIPCAANEIKACQWRSIGKMGESSVRRSARQLVSIDHA